MTFHRGVIRAVGIVVALAWGAGLAGCHSDDYSGPEFTCTRVEGVWEVVSEPIDHEVVMGQTWTISQKGDCSVTVTPNYSDESVGPFIGDIPGKGTAVEGGLWLRWSKTEPCEIHSEADATVEGNTFSGTLYWSKSGSSYGYCSPALSSIGVTGTRR